MTSVISAIPSAGRIQSVERALRILLAFGSPERQLTVGELARMLDVHKSTASRLIATLVDAGFLERGDGEDDAPLRLGPELARLGRLAVDGRGLVDLARPVMDELAADTGETTTLAIAAGHDAVTVAQSRGKHVVGTGTWLGRRSPLHSTSDGKVLLAFGAATLPGGALDRRTPDTVTDRRALRAQLARARELGYATATGDFEIGLNGIAAPVLDGSGRCHAAICVSGPNYRLTPSDFARIGARCREVADRIGALLDWSAGPVSMDAATFAPEPAAATPGTAAR